MAFFKFRKSGGAPEAAAPAGRKSSGKNAAAAEAETVDAMRRRARHRLIGAALLVIVAVAALPWLFDVPPPTLSPASMPIVIDGQASGKTPTNADLVALAPAASSAATPAAANSTPAASASVPTPASSQVTPTRPENPTVSPAASMAAAATAPHPEKKPPALPTPSATRAQPEPSSLDALIAQRQTQEQPAATAPSTPPEPAATHSFPEKGRFVVQIGAYVDPEKVTSVRQKLSQAGLDNYTQRVTVNGQQITRVRIGPFTSRKQMEQAAAKVRALGLPVSMYQL